MLMNWMKDQKREAYLWFEITNHEKNTQAYRNYSLNSC